MKNDGMLDGTTNIGVALLPRFTRMAAATGHNVLPVGGQPLIDPGC